MRHAKSLENDNIQTLQLWPNKPLPSVTQINLDKKHPPSRQIGIMRHENKILVE